MDRGRTRRRLRFVTSDDEEEGQDDVGKENTVITHKVGSAPFPGLAFPTHSSPIPHRHLYEDNEDDDVDIDNYDDGDVNDFYNSDAEQVASVHSDNDKEGAVAADADSENLDAKTLLQLKSMVDGARKKTVRRPMPKLDPSTYVDTDFLLNANLPKNFDSRYTPLLQTFKFLSLVFLSYHQGF